MPRPYVLTRVFSSVAALLVFGAAFLHGADAGSALADAAMKGDLAAVRVLLQKKAEVNGTQLDGSTAIFWAAYRGDVEMADALLRAGAQVTTANRVGITPLALAALDGNAPMIERLLKAGADAKARGPNGETMVMYATYNGSPEALKVLVAAGADVNAKEYLRNTTALMWAAAGKNPAVVKALIELGADVRATSGLASLPQYRVEGRVNIPGVQTAQAVRRRGAEAGRTYEEQRAFEAAEAARAGTRGGGRRGGGRRGGAETLAQDTTGNTQFAGLLGTDTGGLTPLVFAAREGSLETARLLLDGGADVNQVTQYGWSPLLVATNNRNYRLAQLLVERGADVNLPNKAGWTPLYLATDNRNIEGGDYPVPKADVDDLEFIGFLLDHKADVNFRGVKQNTSVRSNFTDGWFLEAGATAFVRAAQSCDVELMKLLLARGADATIPTEHGDNALLVAAGIGWVDGLQFERSPQHSYDAVSLLLNLGLDPNYANPWDGRTALMGAALKGRPAVVQLLVDRGAKLETRDKGSRDTSQADSVAAGHTWQAIDYADGLIRFATQMSQARPETAALIRKLMAEHGLEVPPPNRAFETICKDVLCVD
jgi:ankyrin repeat protein